MKKLSMTLIICIFFSTHFAIGSEGVEIHGVISQGYVKSETYNYFADSEDGTFQFNEMGINFRTSPVENLHIAMQLFARDYGDLFNDEIYIDWAYASYEVAEFLTITAGSMKIPYGLYMDTRDIDATRVPIFLPSGTYFELYREFFSSTKGIGVSGNISLLSAGSLDYSLLVGQNETSPDGGLGKATRTRLSLISNNLSFSEIGFTETVGTNLIWSTPLNGLRVGFSHSYNEEFKAHVNNMEAGAALDNVINQINNLNTFMYSIEYAYNNLLLASELWSVKYDSVVSMEFMGAPQPPSKDSVHTIGYYFMGSYIVNNYLEVGGYYTEVLDNFDDQSGSGRVASGTFEYKHQAYIKDICLTIRLNINANTCIKLEEHFINGTLWIDSDNIGVDFKDKDWSMFAVKVSYNF